MPQRKKTQTKRTTKRAGTTTKTKAPMAPVNARRVGPEALARAIAARGEDFGAKTWRAWQALTSPPRVAQVEPRTH